MSTEQYPRMMLMDYVVLYCGEDIPELPSTVWESSPHKHGDSSPIHPEIHRLSTIPKRSELSFLSDLRARYLPEDPTPSLEEIAANPSVDHLGEPQPSPQQPLKPVRIIVCGSDASCAAVATALMRKDMLWVELAFIPASHLSDSSTSELSPLSSNWGLDSLTLAEQIHHALHSPALPTPVIRDDSGYVTLGKTLIHPADGTEFVGEIIVDSDTLLFQDHPSSHRISSSTLGLFGATFSPMLTAPGIAAARIISSPAPPHSPSLWSRFLSTLGIIKPVPAAYADPHSLMTGRALQVGGADFMVIRDGLAHPRPLHKSTFYRHLRDGMFVRLAH